MKTRINPYLNFNGNASEAMTFYKSCIGGELNISLRTPRLCATLFFTTGKQRVSA